MMDHRTPMNVTTLSDGTQLQYINVADPHATLWVSSLLDMTTTDQPQHAQAFMPKEALQAIDHMKRMGYQGLSLTNALPNPARTVAR